MAATPSITKLGSNIGARIDDVSLDPRFVVHPSQELTICSMLCVPITWRGRGIGVISSTSEKTAAFASIDQQLLEFLGATIAGDLETARLYRLSMTDPLTGAFNRRFLDDWLPRQVQQSTLGSGRLAAASRPLQKGSSEYVDQWVNWGAGLRAAQFLVLGAKARALILGNTHVTVEDVQALAGPVLRHRILVNYRAEAEGITTEKVIQHLLDNVPPEIK